MKFDSMKEQFHFSKHQVFQIKAANKAEEEKVKAKDDVQHGDVWVDETTGKLMVRDTPLTKASGFKRKHDPINGIGSDDEDDEEDQVKDELSKNKKKKTDAEDKTSKADQQETLAARMLKKANMLGKKDNTHFVRESGEMYKAKGQTKGDVLIPGKIAPHAFVQLNPMVSNASNTKGAEQEEPREVS